MNEQSRYFKSMKYVFHSHETCYNNLTFLWLCRLIVWVRFWWCFLWVFLWKWRRNFNFTEQQNITDPFHPWDFFLIINYFQTTPMPFLLLMAGALNWSQNAMPLLQLSSYKWHNKFIFKIFQFDIVYESF